VDNFFAIPKERVLLRKQKEISQEVLGGTFHLTQSIIAHYEAGRNNQVNKHSGTLPIILTYP